MGGRSEHRAPGDDQRGWNPAHYGPVVPTRGQWLDHLNTYENNVLARNIKRDPHVALLIDSAEMPYKSMHFNGVAHVAEEAAAAEELGRLYERYLGSREAATDYGRQLTSAGKRVSIRFTPDRSRTIDFAKLG